MQNFPRIRYVSVKHDSDLPIITGDLQGEKVKILVDSGSSVSLIDYNTFCRLRARSRLEPVATNICLRSITGEKLEVAGCYKVHLKLKGGNILTTVFVSRYPMNANYSVLLGMNALRQHRLRFDAERSALIFPYQGVDDERRLASPSPPHREPPQRTEQPDPACFPPHIARLTRKEVIQPHTEKFVNVTLRQKEWGSETLMFEPLPQRKKNNILLSRSVNAVNTEGNYEVRIANNSDSEIWLNKSTKLFEVEPVQIREYPRKGKHRSEGTNSITPNDFQLNHLNLNDREKVLNLLMSYKDVFAKDCYGLDETNLIEHEIHLTDNKPIRLRPYKVPHALKPELNTQVNELLDSGIIRRSDSGYSFPVVLVMKKQGDYRFCVDFRKLNEITKKDSYPLPLIHQSLDLLGKCKIFSSLDLTTGFHQIPIRESDKHKTAFICDSGLYEFNRLPFGLINAPATFERAMDTAFYDLRDDAILVYVDDILCASPDLESHLKKLETIFQRLRKHRLKIKPSKCQFLRKEISYLGHTLDQYGVRPDSRNLESIVNFPAPRNLKQVRSFLGMAGYYRRHIKNFAALALPLTNLTRKGVKFDWDERCQQAFEKFKDLLTSKPVLAFPDFEKKFFVTCDASGIAIAGILEQEDEKGIRHPIAYFSRKLNPAEKHYSTTEKEALSCLAAISHFRIYLVGRHFTVITDHRPLKWLMNLKTPNSRLVRWNLALTEYSFDVIHRPGSKNVNADVLSRHVGALDQDDPGDAHVQQGGEESGSPLPHPSSPSREIMNDQPFAAEWSENFHAAQRADAKLQPIIRYLEGNDYSSIDKISDSLFLKDGLLCHYSLPAFNSPRQNVAEQIVVPDSLKSEVLKSEHDGMCSGHFAFEKTLKSMKRKWFWLNMYADVKNYVSSCPLCLEKRGFKPNQKAELVTPKIEAAPWSKVAMDIVGPLPMTEKGNKYALVLTDYFTKFVEAVPIPNQSAATVADAFVKVILNYGIPHEILTDRGSNFMSELMMELYRKLRIRKLNTTAYHPSADGQAERQIRTLMNSLALYCAPNQKDWDQLLPFVVMAYRASVHTATNETPNFLMFGRDLNIPGELMRSSPTFSYNESRSYTEDLVNKLQEAYQIVSSNLGTAADAAKANRAKRSTDKGIKVGELVYLYTPRVRSNQTKKLTRMSTGPFRVLSQTSPVNYTIAPINDMRKKQLVHVDRIFKYPCRRTFDTWEFREGIEPEYMQAEESAGRRSTTPVEFQEDMEDEWLLPPICRDGGPVCIQTEQSGGREEESTETETHQSTDDTSAVELQSREGAEAVPPPITNNGDTRPDSPRLQFYFLRPRDKHGRVTKAPGEETVGRALAERGKQESQLPDTAEKDDKGPTINRVRVSDL